METDTQEGEDASFMELFPHRAWTYLRVRYRFIAYSLYLGVLCLEVACTSSTGVLMVGGMVQENCTDPDDPGTHCWSPAERASVLGAVYYGLVLQILVAEAGRRIGYNQVVRIYLLASGCCQLCFPWIASVSVNLLIFTQVIRGILASSIYVFTNSEFLRHWTTPAEKRVFWVVF